jgi:hypothetical protein
MPPFIYDVTLKNFRQDDPNTHHLFKRIRAPGAGWVADWLAFHGLSDRAMSTVPAPPGALDAAVVLSDVPTAVCPTRYKYAEGRWAAVLAGTHPNAWAQESEALDAPPDEAWCLTATRCQELTQLQVTLLLDTFFMGNLAHATYVADTVRSVAHALLTVGQCVVPGDGRIWIGGPANHIGMTKAPGSVGCTLLTLDLEAFLSAVWVQHRLRDRKDQLRAEALKLDEAIRLVSGLLPAEGANACQS